MSEIKNSVGESLLDLAASEFEKKPKGGRLRDRFFEQAAKEMGFDAQIGTSAASSGAAGDTPASAKSKVNKELWEAMKTARSSQNITFKSRQPMPNFLSSCSALTAEELKGLVTHIQQREHPAMNETSQRVVLSLMKAVQRQGAGQYHSELLEKVTEQFDQALLALWCDTKAHALAWSNNVVIID
eukprot:11159638-Lingulodinium_polyedra.AAC.1